MRATATRHLRGFLAIVAGAALLGACGTAGGSHSTTTTSGVTTTSTPPPTTTTTTPAPGLAIGARGPRVVALQRRLIGLGYWLGRADGVFGDSTEQAVYALQKAAGIPPDGVVGPSTESALLSGTTPHPRSTQGRVVEVDLASDLLMLVDNGRLLATLNTSTGGGYWYYSDGGYALAETPVGVFHVYRELDGPDFGPLGELWRPKFFDGGFAVHGDSWVPPYPVSHGCVRVSNEAIDWIWQENLMPIGTEVWVYS